MNDDAFLALCKTGKFKDALALAIGDAAKQKYSPSRFSLDKHTGRPIFYRGNKRVEIDPSGEWLLAKNTGRSDD